MKKLFLYCAIVSLLPSCTSSSVSLEEAVSESQDIEQTRAERTGPLNKSPTVLSAEKRFSSGPLIQSPGVPGYRKTDEQRASFHNIGSMVDRIVVPLDDAAHLEVRIHPLSEYEIVSIQNTRINDDIISKPWIRTLHDVRNPGATVGVVLPIKLYSLAFGEQYSIACDVCFSDGLYQSLYHSGTVVRIE